MGGEPRRRHLAAACLFFPKYFIFSRSTSEAAILAFFAVGLQKYNMYVDIQAVQTYAALARYLHHSYPLIIRKSLHCPIQVPVRI